MTLRLPNGEAALVDIRKLEDYCLDLAHPRGRHKARVFRQALDLGRGDAAWLQNVLLEAAGSGEAVQVAADAWGTQWRLDVSVRRYGRTARLRTIWIVRTDESMPRFVSCWVL